MLRPRTILLALVASLCVAWLVAQPTTTADADAPVRTPLPPGSPNVFAIAVLVIAVVAFNWSWVKVWKENR